MEPDYWIKRWQENEIGFHQDVHHPAITEFFPHFSRYSIQKVFIPLCGKSPDLLWFVEHGIEVVGIELSPLALEQFVEENALQFHKESVAGMDCYRAPGLTLWCGDYFALEPEQLTGVDFIYDRAALVALPEPLRVNYCKHLLYLFNQPPPVLLITLEYNEDLMSGPPFSVSEAFVQQHYPAHRVSLLQSTETKKNNPLLERGIDYFIERIFKLDPVNSKP